MHHFFSNLELHSFVLVEARDDVRDIHEQVAIDADVYNAIAQELDAPPFPSGFVPTSDLVLFLDGAQPPFVEVLSCKPAAEALVPAVAKKLAAERRYWELRGARFRVFTEEDLPHPRIDNLLFTRPFARRDSWLPMLADGDRRHVLDRLRQMLIDDRGTALADICRRFEQASSLAPGTGMAGVRFAIAQRLWRINWDVRIDPEYPTNWLVA